MSKILTITIPSYNVETYMNEVLPTFLDPAVMDKIEILIVNDGSKDGTAALGKEYEAKYPGVITLVDKENGGHGSTINKGIELATGKYFKVVDGDDWVDTAAFVKFVNFLEKTDSDVVATPHYRVNEETKEKELRGFEGVEYEKEYRVDDVLLTLRDKYQMHNLTFKTDIVRKIPKISEHCFYVDVEYIMYPLKYLETISFLNEAVYQYRVGNANQSVSTQNFMKNRNMHKHVIGNVLKYYETEELSAAKKEFLKKRISLLIDTQIRIYLCFEPSDEIKQELLEFCHNVKNTDPTLLDMLEGKIFKLLKVGDCSLYNMIARKYSKESHELG